MSGEAVAPVHASGWAGIRKALIAGGGALGTGLAALLVACHLHLSEISSDQISSVLFLALSTAVGTFALPNKYAAVVDQVEHKAADLGGAVVVGKVIPVVSGWQDDVLATLNIPDAPVAEPETDDVSPAPDPAPSAPVAPSPSVMDNYTPKVDAAPANDAAAHADI